MGDDGDSAPSGVAQVTRDAAQRPPRGRSIMHGNLNDGRIKFLSLDPNLEAGGERAV